ncbi:glycosyltransferase family 2 protein [Paenibacillus vini]|uniref:Glycosyltransferase 2-like domain-containing protein n=1 Tax=Paenibacillus vini TaxID=1476024 RepID=A0ABQ4M6I9_9BACL|nr:glycosyltransferase [Paenibacillus vini]GIP51614.1 hypothetical protein J42TS3_06490 [Paenibacillus vini]
METDIKISIIMPMFNVEEYIFETIESVLVQTMENFELIVVDDNSSDRSCEIVSRYTERDDRLVLVRQLGKGVSSARNIGLGLAQGDYITFLDADDLLMPDSLEILYENAIKSKADIVVGHHNMFNAKSRELSWVFNAYPSLNISGEKTIYANRELLQLPYCWGKLYTRKLIKNIQFPEHISFGEDQVFISHAYLKANKILLIDAIIYDYRKREGQVTQSGYLTPEKYVSDVITVFNNVKENIEIYGSEFRKKETYIYYLNSYLIRNLFSCLTNGLLSDDTSIQRVVLNQYKEWIITLDSEIFKGIYKNLEDVNYSIEKMQSIFDVEIKKIYKELFDLVNQKWNETISLKFNDKPVITIRTLAYNVEQYISECIESVLNQSLSNFKWVILDNGSTDRTGDIIEQYALRDERIKFYRNEKNSIIYGQPNPPEFDAHFENLETEYWCLLDSDDYLHPDFLQELYVAAKKTNADIAVGGTEKFYEGNRQPREERLCPGLFMDDITRMGELFPSFYFMFSVYWGKLIKSSVLTELHEYRVKNSRFLKHADDTLFCLDLLKIAKSVVSIDKALHFYRIRATSYYHSKIDKERYLDYVRLYEESSELLRNWNQLSKQNSNFLVEKMYFSVVNCLEIISKSREMSMDEKVQNIQLMWANETMINAFQEKGITNHFYQETQKVLDEINTG